MWATKHEKRDKKMSARDIMINFCDEILNDYRAVFT